MGISSHLVWCGEDHTAGKSVFKRVRAEDEAREIQDAKDDGYWRDEYDTEEEMIADHTNVDVWAHYTDIGWGRLHDGTSGYFGIITSDCSTEAVCSICDIEDCLGCGGSRDFLFTVDDNRCLDCLGYKSIWQLAAAIENGEYVIGNIIDGVGGTRHDSPALGTGANNDS